MRFAALVVAIIVPGIAAELLVQAAVAGEETLNGHGCHKVTGLVRSVYPSRAVKREAITVWVDAESPLIQKVFEDTPKGYAHRSDLTSHDYLRAVDLYFEYYDHNSVFGWPQDFNAHPSGPLDVEGGTRDLEWGIESSQRLLPREGWASERSR